MENARSRSYAFWIAPELSRFTTLDLLPLRFGDSPDQQAAVTLMQRR